MFTDGDFIQAACGGDGDHPGRAGFWGRLVVKFVIAYVAIAFCYRDEVLFRHSSIPVMGQIVEMFELPTKRGPEGGMVQVKYRFRDPESGASRTNSVSVSRRSLPDSDEVAVQYVPGEHFRSRLALQADPVVGWLFLAMNTVLGVTVAAWLGVMIREANHRPLTRQQRAVAALNRERRQTRRNASTSASKRA